MESIGTLAGGIAHDLNNVLAPIMMATAIMEMRFPDPESQSLIAVLTECAQRGADMVGQVLTFARGVDGQRMEVQIASLVQDIEKIVKDTFYKHIQVRTLIPHDLWTVEGDPTQLHQVLLNLCVNARDAMPQGGTLILSAGNLVIDAHYAALNSEARPGPYVFLEIEDSGTGIPAEVIEKIFDPFFTTKELGKGTGLGLSTTLAIAKSHGGFIRVQSEPGKGTTFKVYLPAQVGTSTAVKAQSGLEMPPGNGELILVVDDEPSVRQITRQTLEAFGYRVLLAADGVEALAIYAGQGAQIALVLTDMMMPVMDGAATIQVLRKLNPELPIIAASGLSANSQGDQATRLGVSHFLPKPYTAETLLKALRKALPADR
jgi:CheY-like chemotaxis protein